MAGVQFKIKGLKRWQKAMQAGPMKAELDVQLSRARLKAALVVVAYMRKAIQSGNYAKNASLTIAIKGSDKPLVDSGNLFQSITHKQVDADSTLIGVMRTDKGYNVTKIVVEGVQIEVTDKMRSMFFALWLASTGRLDPSKLSGRAAEIWAKARRKEFYPLRPETSVIVIPGRDFITRVMNNTQMAGAIKKIFISHIDAALTKRARVSDS